MKKTAVLSLVAFFLLFSNVLFSQKKAFNEKVQAEKVAKVLDELNLFAATADYQNYFDLFAAQSTYIGTDAAEVWTKNEFMVWAKPYFDSGQTWKFTSLKRNITFSSDGNYAWFDELLDTQMKLCRGSGVLERIDGTWKIKQYVLSMTIPNEVSNEAIKIKSPIEETVISDLKKK